MCTSLIISDVNGHAYHGRTLEFSVFVPISVTYFPVGTTIESSTPEGKQGLTFNTQYAILGMMAGVIPHAKQLAISEAINDQGLSFSGNQLNFSTSPPVGNDPAGGVGDGPRGNASSSEVTYWTVMADLSRNLLYFRTISALNWTVIDMSKLVRATQMKSVPITVASQTGAMEFNQFYG